MPAMYPEELRRLRELNPGFQYDFRGNLIDDGGYGGDALSRAVAGLDGYNYQSDQFVGPVFPGQQQGYTYADASQVGPQMPGQYKAPPLPEAGTAYSRWDPNSNSWFRTTNNPDEFQTLGRMDDWKWGQETPH